MIAKEFLKPRIPYSDEYATFADYLNAIAKELLETIAIFKKIFSVIGYTPTAPEIPNIF